MHSYSTVVCASQHREGTHGFSVGPHCQLAVQGGGVPDPA